MRFSLRQKSLISFQRSLLTAFFSAALVTLISLQPWGKKLESVVARPIEFRVRRFLKQDPKFDPRLQIYVVEDSTVQYLKKEGLSLSDWATILEGFRNQNPRAVLLDKIFGIPNETSDAQRFVQKLKSLPFPVIAGAFVVPSSIKARPLLPTYSLLENLTPLTSNKPKGADELDWLTLEPGYPYGPAENVLPAFKYVGHLMYANESFFKPLIRISTYQGVPGAPFFTAKDLKIENSRLIADGFAVPINRDGMTLVNFVAPSLFYDRTEAISQLFELVKNKKPFPKLPDDAVVLFLPNQYTGNSDYKETPFGTYPGGYVIASLVNSVLTGNWLMNLPFEWMVPLAAGTFTTVLLSVASGYSFWVLVFGCIGIIIIAGLVTFSYVGIAIPWLFSSLSFFLASFVGFATNAREILRRRMEGVAGTSIPLEVRYDEKTGEPKKLGRYHVMERIARGGMGEVYRAKIYGAGGFEKEFALKRIAPEYWKDKTIVQAFLDEAKLSSYLTHRNIVQVFEFLRLEDSYLLVMEYVRGQSLKALLTQMKRGQITIPREIAVYIVRQILKALDYAHSKKEPNTDRPLKLVHRDISPHNVLISHDGSVKLIDFGIAKGSFTTENTKTGVVKGKFSYMSPEQAAGRPLDRRSDLFSVTLVLFEMITGKRALGDNADSEMNTLKEVKEWNVDSINIDKYDLPATLKRIIVKGLQNEPENRYQKAEDMHRDLSLYLNECRFGIGQKMLSEFITQVINEDYTQSVHARAIPTDDKTRVGAVEEPKTGTED